MRAYVVGGGPSAEEFDWGERSRELVIACHQAAWRLPFAPQIELSVDWPYWKERAPRPGSIGVLVELHLPTAWSRGRTRGLVAEGLLHLPCAAGPEHWEHRWGETLAEGLFVGGSSGPAAMNLAYLLGATEVHLVGIDLQGEGGTWDRWREAFAFAAGELERRGVRVAPRGRWVP